MPRTAGNVKECKALMGKRETETETQDNEVQADFAFPKEWRLFGPVGKDDPEPESAGMKDVPAELSVAGKRLAGQKASFTGSRLGVGALLAARRSARRRTCWRPLKPRRTRRSNSAPGLTGG
jgi:hypothetical protein